VAAAGDPQARMLLADALDHGVQHLLAGTQEVDGTALFLGHVHQPLEQVDPGHPFGQRPAQHPGGPHHRLAVGHDEVAAGHRVAQRGVPAHLDDLRGVDHADLDEFALLDGIHAEPYGLTEGERVDRDAEQVAAFADGEHAGHRPCCSAAGVWTEASHAK
jgi:hypothetical protein